MESVGLTEAIPQSQSLSRSLKIFLGDYDDTAVQNLVVHGGYWAKVKYNQFFYYLKDFGANRRPPKAPDSTSEGFRISRKAPGSTSERFRIKLPRSPILA